VGVQQGFLEGSARSSRSGMVSAFSASISARSRPGSAVFVLAQLATGRRRGIAIEVGEHLSAKGSLAPFIQHAGCPEKGGLIALLGKRHSERLQVLLQVRTCSEPGCTGACRAASAAASADRPFLLGKALCRGAGLLERLSSAGRFRLAGPGPRPSGNLPAEKNSRAGSFQWAACLAFGQGIHEAQIPRRHPRGHKDFPHWTPCRHLRARFFC